ncbi:hypothetical protein EG878_17160, partial [Enterococcus faecalis]
ATLTATLKATLTATYTGAPDVGTLVQSIAYAAQASLSNGTGANQANAPWADTRALSASSSENLDLAGGLTDAFGTALTFTKIKAVIIEADDANANDVVVGGAASNAWLAPFGDALKVKPGGFIMLVAPDANGLAVTAGTGDILKVANGGSGTSVTYTVTLVGVV